MINTRPVRVVPTSSCAHRASACSCRGRRKPRRVRSVPLLLEPMEDRCLLSLLGIAQQSSKPDIASGSKTNISYTQLNTNANPFHYDSIPLSLTLANGTVDRISNQANKTAASTRLDLVL